MNGEMRTRSSVGGRDTVLVAAERESVTVTWGKETFRPCQFMAFDVGPFSVTVSVRRGETIREAAGRAMVELDAIAEEEFSRKTAEFLARVRSLDSAIRGSAKKDGK